MAARQNQVWRAISSWDGSAPFGLPSVHSGRWTQRNANREATVFSCSGEHLPCYDPGQRRICCSDDSSLAYVSGYDENKTTGLTAHWWDAAIYIWVCLRLHERLKVYFKAKMVSKPKLWGFPVFFLFDNNFFKKIRICKRLLGLLQPIEAVSLKWLKMTDGRLIPVIKGDWLCCLEETWRSKASVVSLYPRCSEVNLRLTNVMYPHCHHALPLALFSGWAHKAGISFNYALNFSF